MHEVLPVACQKLLIRRAGRDVLNVPALSLGHVGCTAIVGPNGAGKSLLVRTLCDLQVPDSGRVTWAGQAPDTLRRHRVGLLLQRPVLLRRSALNNVLFALRATGMSRAAGLPEAQQALHAAGLSALVDVSAHRLSGGEQQRLALARALALKPDMLFMDEATANVDPASTRVIEQQLIRAMTDGLKVVAVSHDMGQVRRLADEVVLMHNGGVVEQSRRQHFFEQATNPLTQRWLDGELLVQ